MHVTKGEIFLNILEKIGAFFGRFMAIIVLAIAALSLFVPQSTLWIQTGWVNYLLMIVMFGMGLTGHGHGGHPEHDAEIQRP